MSDSNSKSAGWILYDDSCGVCRRWVPFWEKTLRRRGFEIVPLQAAWVREKTKLSEAELMRDLWLLLPDGKLIFGADTYRYAMKRLWWAWPVFLFSVAPIGRNIFNFCYRKFAANRFQISQVCGLSNPSKK
jgi:predicted DCC family thiol-disulfide oxidoreductase YuxK